MHYTHRLRLIGLGMAGALLIAAAASSLALFEASTPGSDLEPIGGAELLVELIQDQESILWSALGVTVDSYTVLGWPTSDGVNELGGALVLERPASGTAGSIDFAEKPMSISFSLDG